MIKIVRCPNTNPKTGLVCDRFLAEVREDGWMRIKCPRCHQFTVIENGVIRPDRQLEKAVVC